jgi:hypothetical protein
VSKKATAAVTKLHVSRFQSLIHLKKIRKDSVNESGTLRRRGMRHSSHKWAPRDDITKAHWPIAPFTESRTKLGRSLEDRPASPEGGSGFTPRGPIVGLCSSLCSLRRVVL